MFSYENTKTLNIKTKEIISNKDTISTIKTMRGDLHNRSIRLAHLPVTLTIGAYTISLNRGNMEELDKILDRAQKKCEDETEILENEILEILREEARNHEESETA